jgi:hypothetical protein
MEAQMFCEHKFLSGKRKNEICGKLVKNQNEQHRCSQHKKCPHGKRKHQCRDCGGSQICEHGRVKSQCRDCGGSSICKHNRIRPECKQCGGGSICVHNRIRSKCKECGGGGICEHNKRKYTCKECGGSQICEHNRKKCECKQCDPNGYLSSLVRCRVRSALKKVNADKDLRSMEYLCCTVADYREYLQIQLDEQIVPDGRERMTWENQGKLWHIDHIIPLTYKENPDDIIPLEETMARLHFTNTQIMYADLNISKGNRFIGS